MRLPVVRGTIKRRLLVNFRVDPDVMSEFLPDPFRPKLHAGYAIAGVCLIRLEHVRPAGVPPLAGVASENAAHRVAVEWRDAGGDAREGVFIPRRDTTSKVNVAVGGRLFPGEHNRADFHVVDDGVRVELKLDSEDGTTSVRVVGRAADELPRASCFSSLEESSRFFEGGSLGYSPARGGGRLDGLRLKTFAWEVQPLEVESVSSSFFDDRATFPPGTVEFDHALIMRDVAHEWHAAPDVEAPARAAVLASQAP
jgi:hypothetical protein